MDWLDCGRDIWMIIVGFCGQSAYRLPLVCKRLRDWIYNHYRQRIDISGPILYSTMMIKDGWMELDVDHTVKRVTIVGYRPDIVLLDVHAFDVRVTIDIVAPKLDRLVFDCGTLEGLTMAVPNVELYDCILDVRTLSVMSLTMNGVDVVEPFKTESHPAGCNAAPQVQRD